MVSAQRDSCPYVIKSDKNLKEAKIISWKTNTMPAMQDSELKIGHRVGNKKG